MMAEQKKDKNNSKDMRVTREGLRPVRAQKSGEPVESDMEKGWPPAWSVSFADMMTLLMCFFILWYALTVMKFPAHLLKIKTKKELYLNVEKTDDLLETYEFLMGKRSGGAADEDIIKEIAKKATSSSAAMLVSIKDYLDESNLTGNVDIDIKGDELIISPRSDLFFDKGKADVKEENQKLLKQVAFILKSTPSFVRVEGHTDDTPIMGYRRHVYPSNWELSTARAVNVARYFMEKEEIEPSRVSVSGYGPLKPIYDNADPEGKAGNRRVEIHILVMSDKSADAQEGSVQ
ncbi:MAG: flagellar motor protein MotB [Candidatus Omnitrophota bacterium]